MVSKPWKGVYSLWYELKRFPRIVSVVWKCYLVVGTLEGELSLSCNSCGRWILPSRRCNHEDWDLLIRGYSLIIILFSWGITYIWSYRDVLNWSDHVWGSIEHLYHFGCSDRKANFALQIGLDGSSYYRNWRNGNFVRMHQWQIGGIITNGALSGGTSNEAYILKWALAVGCGWRPYLNSNDRSDISRGTNLRSCESFTAIYSCCTRIWGAFT